MHNILINLIQLNPDRNERTCMQKSSSHDLLRTHMLSVWPDAYVILVHLIQFQPNKHRHRHRSRPQQLLSPYLRLQPACKHCHNNFFDIIIAIYGLRCKAGSGSRNTGCWAYSNGSLRNVFEQSCAQICSRYVCVYVRELVAEGVCRGDCAFLRVKKHQGTQCILL